MDTSKLQTFRNIAADSQSTIEKYLENPLDRAARIKALRDAKNLVTALQDGDDAFFDRIAQVSAAQALRFVMAVGVPESIPRKGSITAAKLAAEVGSEKTLIIRMMRMLVADGTFDEVEQDEYAHTVRSINLLDPGYGYFFEIMMDDMLHAAWSRMPEYFKSHPLESPSSPTHNPYSWTYGMEGQDWIKVIGRTPENMRKFAIGISGKWSTVPAVGIYPFDTELAPLSATITSKAEQAHTQTQIQNRVLIVDVGASQGGTMKEIRRTFPQLTGKIIVQDLARVIDNVPADYLPPELDIHPMVHDFWTPQPVRNACVYYLRRIMHDWPDDLCRKILKHNVDAMAPDSRLLIADVLIPDRVQKEDLYCYWMDLTMLTFAGKERSEADWRALFESVGLELVKVWRAEVGTQAVMEGRLNGRDVK